MRKYYLKILGEESGPYSPRQIREMAAAGKISPDFWIRIDGKWKTLDSVKGIKFGSPPASGPVVQAEIVKEDTTARNIGVGCLVLVFAFCCLGYLLDPNDKQRTGPTNRQPSIKPSNAKSSSRTPKPTLPKKPEEIVLSVEARVAMWEIFDKKFPYGYSTGWEGMRVEKLNSRHEYYSSGKVSVTNAFNAKRDHEYEITVQMLSKTSYKLISLTVDGKSY